MRKLYLLKTFLLACLFSIVGGGMAWADGSDDFAESFKTDAPFNYATRTSNAGWVCTNAQLVSIDGTIAPTINGKTTAVGTITSPTLSGGCGTLSFKYANTYSESKGVSVTVTIKDASGAEVFSQKVSSTTVDQSTVYTATIEGINVAGNFSIEIKNNSPSNNSKKNKDRVSIWNIQWTGYSAGGVILEPAGLSFGDPAPTVEADLYKLAEFTAPTLINPNRLAVTYGSSNEDVATVDAETGKVTLVGVGTTTITAKSKETATHDAGSASYTLNVTDSTPIAGLAGLRAKVTSTTAQQYTVNVTNAVVTYVNGKNAYLQTAEGAVLCFGNDALDLVKGQKFDGQLIVSAKLYNSLVEITSIDTKDATVGEATAEELTPQVVTVAQIIDTPTAYESRYVTIKDAQVTAVFSNKNAKISQEGNEYALRQNGKDELSVNLNDIIDVTGFPSIYNKTLQFSVYEQDHIVTKAEVPYFRFAQSEYSVMHKSDFDAPAVETNVEGTPAYTSSNPAVATVDGKTGAVTLVGVGTTVITATLGAYSASYTLTVTPYVQTVFVPVVDQSEVVAGGKYIVLNKDGDKAMGAKGAGDYLDAVTVALENGVYTGTVDGTAEPYAFTLVASGAYFKLQHGSTYLKYGTSGSATTWETNATDDTALWQINMNSANTSPITNKKATTRQLGYNYNDGTKPRFASYQTPGTKFPAVLYRQYEAQDITLTIGEAGYATYYSDKALVVPAGMAATTVTAANNDGTLAMAWEYQAGSVVPAGTAVLLRGAANSYATYLLRDYPVAAPEGNLLRGSVEDATTEGGEKYYKLTYATINGERVLGFFWGAADGAAFTNAAGKAYLALPAEAAANGYRLDGGDVTAIGQIATDAQGNGQVYSISGVRMDGSKRLPAGIYVINGRKVIVK